MAAQYGNNNRKNGILGYLICGISSSGLTGLLKTIVEDSGLDKTGEFFNSWPFFYTVLILCITAVIIVLIQELSSIAIYNKVKEENQDLRNRIKELEKKIDKLKDEKQELQVDVAQKDERIKIMEEMQGEKKLDSIADLWSKRKR